MDEVNNVAEGSHELASDVLDLAGQAELLVDLSEALLGQQLVF
jgi:hypothetical protein